VERAAVLPRLTWQDATVSEVRRESATGTTLRLDVDDWAGHRPGQHVDVRLTAPDGYTAVRPYSLASAAGSGVVELTVDTTPGGEVSVYLARQARPGHHLEIRGPLGDWFVWDSQALTPVQLVAGGSGLVPLMSMIRTHGAMGHPAPMRLLYSVADPEHVLYADEIATHEASGLASVIYTRRRPEGDPRPPRRATRRDLDQHLLPASMQPTCFVCGPTGFVEALIGAVVGLGYATTQIRAERYGERDTP